MKHEKCRNCRYSALMDMGEDGEMLRACIYILKTGTRRPSPPGENCTAWERDTKKDEARKKWAFSA